MRRAVRTCIHICARAGVHHLCMCMSVTKFPSNGQRKHYDAAFKVHKCVLYPPPVRLSENQFDSCTVRFLHAGRTHGPDRNKNTNTKSNVGSDKRTQLKRHSHRYRIASPSLHTIGSCNEPMMPATSWSCAGASDLWSTVSHRSGRFCLCLVGLITSLGSGRLEMLHHFIDLCRAVLGVRPFCEKGTCEVLGLWHAV